MDKVIMGARLANKVLLIGWDAADWQVILPLVDGGQMPALKRLLQRGVRGNLTTLTPILSPLLWTSIATGKRADKHGILGFVEPDSTTGQIRPVSSTSRKCKAIWNVLSQAGLRTHVVGWFASHPAEPINGVNISNVFTVPSSAGMRRGALPAGCVQPRSLEDTVAALRVYPDEVPQEQMLAVLPGLAQIDGQDPRPGEVAVALAECLTVSRVAGWIQEHESWDFLAVYYNAVDHLGHHFMAYHPPRRDGISEHDFGLYQGVITAIYRFQDRLLGELVDRAGPETALLLVSDHGFYSDHRRPPESRRSQLKNARLWHRPLGIFCAAGKPFRAGAVVHGASILDITPTVLALLGLPIGDDMDGRPLVSALDSPVEVASIPSWEAVPGDCGMHPPGFQEDPWDAWESLKQLADLGYVDLPTGDMQETARQLRRERLFHLAVHYLETGRPAEAADRFQELVGEEPANVDFLLYLARCRLALGELPACRELLAEVLRHRPHSPHVFFLLGKACSAEEQPAAALTHYLSAEQLDPRLPLLYSAMGQAYFQLQRWTEAERTFRRALELDRDSAAAHLGLAHVYLVQNRFREARAAAQSATVLNHHLADAHFVRGIALARLDQPGPALQAFETCLRIDPRSAAAHRWLAVLHEQATGDQARAAEHRRRAEEL
jgi:tetratricopeptide (TPR) repeat protein